MKQIKSLVNHLLLVRGGKLMLRRFILIANRSHAWISLHVSAFCVFRVGGRWWPWSDSPRSLAWGSGQSRQEKKQGNLDSSKVSTLHCVFLLLLLGFRALTLLVTLIISGTIAQRGQQLTCISYQVENGVYYVPKPKYLVYRVERRDNAIASVLHIF